MIDSSDVEPIGGGLMFTKRTTGILNNIGAKILNNIGFAVLIIILIGIGLRLTIFKDNSVSSQVSAFKFSVSTNPWGDHILIQAPVEITYVPQKNAPDVISITASDGQYYGSFVWTVIPDQGGVQRVLGEYEIQGHVYKICEFVHNATIKAADTAQRYFVINNSGPKYRSPETIDPTHFFELFAMVQPEKPAVPGTQPVPHTDQTPAPADLSIQASALISICTGQIRARA